MPQSSAVARPKTKADAVRVIVAREPEITDEQLQKQLVSEFGPKFRMTKKMAYNYINTARERLGLKKLNHPKRPMRNGQPTIPAPEPMSPIGDVVQTTTQLDELLRLGNAMGWEEVLKTAQIAVKVKGK